MGLHDEDVEPFEHFESVARPGCLIKGMCMENGKPVKHLEPVADFEDKDGICWRRPGGLTVGLHVEDVKPIERFESVAYFEGEGAVCCANSDSLAESVH